MSQNKKLQGFTLIELMLSMTFVSILLVAIAMTIIMMSNIFNKGITLKEVNQIGRSLTDDLQKTISSSQSFEITGPASRYVSKDLWGGRLCVGRYSYIWNYGSAIADNDTSKLYLYEDSSVDIPRFVKVIDPNASYCSNTTKKIVRSDAVELLNTSDHDLAVHNASISSSESASDNKTQQRLYYIEFSVGTNNQKALTDELGYWVCKQPGQPDADPSYCSLVQFKIVALAGNTEK